MRSRSIPLVAVLVALALGATAGIIPEAEEHSRSQDGDLHALLSDPETADAALESVLRRSSALAELEEVAVKGTDLSARGRALLGIQGIRGKEADAALDTVLASGAPPLVQAWAASARINRTADLDSFLPLAQSYVYQYPATARPIELKAAQLLEGASIADMLKLMALQPQLAAAIAPKILTTPSSELVRLMQTHGDDNVRRQAAAYLASQGQDDKGHAKVSAAVRDALAYDKKVKDLPWDGGALYVPAIQWQKNEALDLIRTLIQWNLHCERIDKANEQRQVQNNLRSVQLLQAAGFGNAWPDVSGPDVLVEYGKIAGRQDVWKLLDEQGLLDSRWAKALDQLGKR